MSLVSLRFALSIPETPTTTTAISLYLLTHLLLHLFPEKNRNRPSRALAPQVAAAGSKLTESLLSYIPGGGALVRQRQGYSPGLTYDPTEAVHPQYVPDFIAM